MRKGAYAAAAVTTLFALLLSGCTGGNGGAETSQNTGESTAEEAADPAGTEQETEGARSQTTEGTDGSETGTEGEQEMQTFSDFEEAAAAVRNMKLGWNLGNSLDSYGAWISPDAITNYETAWGNPVVTEELIAAVKASGFNAVRVPVTWYQHMDEDGTVDSEWMARVKTVVDYVIDADMYCILNVHHDNGGGEEAWLRADREMYEAGMRGRYAYLWEQIAEAFADYDDRLLFAGLNETLDADANWGGSTEESYAVINDLNQLFVDTVRGTGGSNEYRNLIVQTYGASSAESQVSGFVLPEDSAENHLIAEVHIYDPSGFCGGSDATWDEADTQVLETIFERLNDKIITAQNVPLIVGEFGSQDKFGTEEYARERAEYADCFVSIAKRYGITCFWWDDGGAMKLFDRASGECTEPELVAALLEAAEPELLAALLEEAEAE